MRVNYILSINFLATPDTPAVPTPKPKNCRCGIEGSPPRLADFNRIIGGKKINPVSTNCF